MNPRTHAHCAIVPPYLLARLASLEDPAHQSAAAAARRALLAQERLGWRAGYVQLGFDVAVVLLALTVVPPAGVLLSAAGAVVLNTVLAMNHRPGRYLGH